MKISIDKNTCQIIEKEDKYGRKQSYIVDPFRTLEDFETSDYNSVNYLYKLVYDCVDVLTDSRYGLISRQMDNTDDNPFCVLLDRIECVFTYRLTRMATNDECMFINPTFWADLYTNSIEWRESKGWTVSNEDNNEVNVNTTKGLCCNLYVFIHELMHCMLDHIREHKVLRDKYPDHDKANIAMDYVCNYDIEEMFPILQGVGTFLNLYYDMNKGNRHWTDEYDAYDNPTEDEEWSDDKKRGYKDTINEIREIIGRVKDTLSDRSSAYHKIVKMYGPALQKLKGIDINTILNESVVDNITKISDDYDEGAIEAIKSALDELRMSSADFSGGDSDNKNDKPSADLVDRDVNGGGHGDGESDDSNSQNGKNGQGGQIGGDKKSSWDVADEIQKDMGINKLMDDVYGDDTQPGQSKLTNSLRKMMDAQSIHNLQNLPSDDPRRKKVAPMIKSLGDNNWTSYLSRFISDYLYKRVDGRMKTRYETINGEVTLYRKQYIRENILRHITIIMDTSGSVMGRQGAYDYFVSEIGKVLESIKSRYTILVDFLTFGSDTYYTRFLHTPGRFLSDTKNNKSFTFGDSGTTDYHDSFEMAHLLMTDKSRWSSFYDQECVSRLKNMIDDENKNHNNIGNDSDYGPSGCTICFTDSDFCWGKKYRGDGFGSSGVRDFRDKLCVFMVLDGGPKDTKCINPTNKNNILEYKIPEDSTFGWNIHFVSADCIKDRVNESVLNEIMQEDDFFDKASIDKIEKMHGSVKSANDEYRGNMTLSAILQNIDELTCNDVSDNMLLLKSLKPDRKIESSIFPRIASITGDLNYALDGYMYIQGNLIGDSASESEVDSNTEYILSKFPVQIMTNSAIIFDQCNDITPKLYEAIKERCGENNVAFMNCKRLCAAINDFSDHPITTIDYILNYWNNELTKKIRDSFDIVIYAIDGSQRFVIKGDSKSDYYSELWNCKVGVYLKYIPKRRFKTFVDVYDDELFTSNEKYSFNYEGFPPFIKFVGIDGLLKIYYGRRKSPGLPTIKGTMCKYNSINKRETKSLDVDGIRVGGVKNGILLITNDDKETTYSFI